MPLNLAQVGEKNRIVRISGRDQTRRHLAILGLVEGQAVTVVSKLSGSMIVSVKGSRLALDKAMTGRIWIEREE